MVKRLPAMRETQDRSLGWDNLLEKEKATHSSILAWRIPRTEEHVRLQSMGSQSRTWLSNFTYFTYWMALWFAPLSSVWERSSWSEPLLLLLSHFSCDSVWPHGLQPTRLLYPWDSPGESTGVGCHCLLQKIFPNQGSIPGFPHCRQMLYHLSHEKHSE